MYVIPSSVAHCSLFLVTTWSPNMNFRSEKSPGGLAAGAEDGETVEVPGTRPRESRARAAREPRVARTCGVSVGAAGRETAKLGENLLTDK